MQDRYIKESDALDVLTNNQTYSRTFVQSLLDRIPTPDVKEVCYGKWEFEPYSQFKRDLYEVEVTAKCSICHRMWREGEAIAYAKVISRKYDDQETDIERVNECKKKLLEESRKRLYESSPFCEKCGAFMRYSSDEIASLFDKLRSSAGRMTEKRQKIFLNNMEKSYQAVESPRHKEMITFIEYVKNGHLPPLTTQKEDKE